MTESPLGSSPKEVCCVLRTEEIRQLRARCIEGERQAASAWARNERMTNVMQQEATQREKESARREAELTQKLAASERRYERIFNSYDQLQQHAFALANRNQELEELSDAFWAWGTPPPAPPTPPESPPRARPPPFAPLMPQRLPSSSGAPTAKVSPPEGPFLAALRRRDCGGCGAAGCSCSGAAAAAAPQTPLFVLAASSASSVLELGL